MITDIIENLRVEGWSFITRTVNSCTVENEYYGIGGNMYIWPVTDTNVRLKLGLDDKDLLIRSSLVISGGEWEVAIFKHNGEYASVATLQINDDFLVLQLLSKNTAQFSNAQRELAVILKSLNIEKLQINKFEVGGHRFTSKIWRYREGRLLCDDGICNLSTAGDNSKENLMQHYRLIERDEAKEYYKFETSSTQLQWLRMGGVVFYAICKHDQPLYEEIKEA